MHACTHSTTESHVMSNPVIPSRSSRDRRQSCSAARVGNRGFTLVELLVVMGIILLFIALAVPAVNSLMGNRSIDAAQNTIAAFLIRTREEAIGMQDYRAVLFTIDPATDRVVGTTLQPATLDQTAQTALAKFGLNPTPVILDVVPDHDQVVLPVGIRLQTVFDGHRMVANVEDTITSDRYVGFNTAQVDGITSGTTSLPPTKYGGVILFGPDGQLSVRPYGFLITSFMNSISNSLQLNGMGSLLNFQGFNGSSTPHFLIPYVNPANGSGATLPPAAQVAFILYDKKAYDTAQDSNGQKMSEANTGLDSAANRATVMVPDDTQLSTNPSATCLQDAWLDTHGTPVMINRYTGALIRGE
jgi:prepilin-type N-terminal cleavage/methylation domain-containing protein